MIQRKNILNLTGKKCISNKQESAWPRSESNLNHLSTPRQLNHAAVISIIFNVLLQKGLTAAIAL